MKFMFFNLMAVIAILYLVAVDGKPIKPIPDLLSSITSKEVVDSKQFGSDLAQRTRQKLVTFLSKNEPKNDTDVGEDKPVKVVNFRPKFMPKPEVAQEPKPVQVAVRPIKKVPPVVDAQPLRPVSKIVSTPKLVSKPVQKFMSRSERRRELNKLAHDMEMMFADKLAQ